MNHTKRRYTSYRIEIGVQEQLMVFGDTKLWHANKQTHAAILTDGHFPLNYIKIFYRLKKSWKYCQLHTYFQSWKFDPWVSRIERSPTKRTTGSLILLLHHPLHFAIMQCDERKLLSNFAYLHIINKMSTHGILVNKLILIVLILLHQLHFTRWSVISKTKCTNYD